MFKRPANADQCCVCNECVSLKGVPFFKGTTDKNHRPPLFLEFSISPFFLVKKFEKMCYRRFEQKDSSFSNNRSPISNNRSSISKTFSSISNDRSSISKVQRLHIFRILPRKKRRNRELKKYGCL